MERSQRTEDSPKGIETTQREDLLIRAAASGQESCKEDSKENRGCTQGEPKNPELAVEKQPPRESRKHQQLEILVLKGQGVPG